MPGIWQLTAQEMALGVPQEVNEAPQANHPTAQGTVGGSCTFMRSPSQTRPTYEGSCGSKEKLAIASFIKCDTDPRTAERHARSGCENHLLANGRMG